MGSGGMNPELSFYVKQNYPDTKSDMSTVFMEKVFHFCNLRGMVSMINIPVWMFSTSYERLRTHLITNKTLVNMLHFGRGSSDQTLGQQPSSFLTIKSVIIAPYLKNYTKNLDRLIT